jgi:hypothetical protein
MQVRSSFVHLVVYNTMVKMELKMDIIRVRLIMSMFSAPANNRVCKITCFRF